MRAARSNQPVIWRDVVDDLRSFRRYADEVARWPRRLPFAEFGDYGSESPYRQTVRELAFVGHSPNDEDDPTHVGIAFFAGTALLRMDCQSPWMEPADWLLVASVPFALLLGGWFLGRLVGPGAVRATAHEVPTR